MTKGYERGERHTAVGWHEWSVGTGDAIERGKPARLFVRTDESGLITITSANVTSARPTARELIGKAGRARSLILSQDDVRFLIEVLPRALAALATEQAIADAEAEIESEQ
jgi:hypothetical protein